MRWRPVLVPNSSLASARWSGCSSGIFVRKTCVPTLVSYALQQPTVWMACTGIPADWKNSGV